MYCKNCGKELSEKAIACPSCGFNPRSENNFCPECGVETKEKQVICVNCGISLKSVKIQSKNKTALCHNRKINIVAIIFGVLMLIGLFLPWISGKFGGDVNALDEKFNKLVGPYGYICLLVSIGAIISLFVKFRYVVYLGFIYLLMALLSVVSLLDKLKSFPIEKMLEGGIGFILAIISVIVFIIITFKELKGSQSIELTDSGFDNTSNKGQSKSIESATSFFKSTYFKFGLPILLALISIVLFYFNGKYVPIFPYIELLLMVYPLVFLKKEKFNSLFNCALILPVFYLLNFIVFLVLIKNGDAYYYLAYKSYLYIYFLLYITMIVALGLYEKFKDTDNKFVILASQINFDKKAYVWIISGFFAIAAFSFADLPLVSFLLLTFPAYIAFKETNKNLFKMVLLLPIAYLFSFVIEQIDWSSIFDQSTFVSESYSDAMYYAKLVYVLLLIASVIYYGYRKIEESNMPIFVKKMKLLVKFNWVIGCFSFIIPIAIIILSSGVLSESKTNSVNIPSDTIVVNVPATQPTQPIAAEKEQSQSVTNVSVRQTIDLYYEDLHSENFEANRYFASEVERFISMKNTTSDAINKYVVNSYFKGYKNNDYSVEDGSYEERSLDNGDTEASFIEVGTCYKVKQDKDLFTRLKMVVLVNPEGKIYKWTQTAVLEKR